MTSSPSAESQFLEQTWEEIRLLIHQVAQMARSEVPEDEFYQGLLQRVVTAVAGIGGAAWRIEGGRPTALLARIQLDQTGLSEQSNGESWHRHALLVQQIASQSQPSLVPPSGTLGDGTDASNPTPCLIVAAPVIVENSAAAVVEVFARADSRPKAQQGYLRFLAEIAALATDFHQLSELKRLRAGQAEWARLQQFSTQAHAGIDLATTAYTCANEGRRIVDCDRVSVAVCYGRRVRLEAVSGQDVLNRRSNTVRLLEQLARQTLRVEEPLWHEGEEAVERPPQVDRALHAYADESHVRSLAILPLFRAVEPDDDAAEASPPAEPEIIGALIAEQFETVAFSAPQKSRLEFVQEHAGLAVGNALEHQRLFLLPLWEALGKATWFLRGHTLPKTLAVGVLLAAAVAALVLIPADFEIEARGTLKPVHQQAVFASVDGDVYEIPAEVAHGKYVQEGELLVQLVNHDLEKKIAEIEGEIETNAKKLSVVRSNRQTETDPDKKRELVGQEEVLTIMLTNLKEQLALLKQQEAELAVRSPIPGEITTWNVRANLLSRPVQRGNRLLEIADLNGEWEVELHVPEDRMGYLMEAYRDPDLGTKLPVTFILATDPTTEYQGSVKQIAMTAEVHEEHGNSVRLTLPVDKSRLPELRPGAGVRARVYCGQRSLGFVYLHDLWEFFYSRVLWRF